jgi:hypothetical protein
MKIFKISIYRKGDFMEKVYSLMNHHLLFELVLEDTIQKRLKTWDMFEQSIIFDNCNEFVFHIEKNGETSVMTDYDCELSYVNKKDETKLEFYYISKEKDFNVSVIYQNDGQTVHKKIKFLAKTDLKLVQSQSDVLNTECQLGRGGEGQPIFIEDYFFLGIEYPSANNEIYGNCIVLHQYPYSELQGEESFELPPVVYGFKNTESIEKTFVRYIYDYTPIKYKTAPSIYNDWAAHDELGSGPELTENLVHSQLDKLEELKVKTGFVFDYYTMDAFWFEENAPYTEFKHRNWPNGPDKVCERIKGLNMKFGLWFDFNSDLVTDGARN